MSRVLWHARHTTTELLGSERAWLNHLAKGPAMAAWNLERGHDKWALDRIAPIMAAIPESPLGDHGSNYLHVYYRAALAAQDTDPRPWEAARRFFEAFGTALAVGDLEAVIAGHRLSLFDVGSNTALAVGADPIRLAAKIHGYCEIHCWVEDEDRPWLADLIDKGLEIGVYRPGMGWDDVQALLRDGKPGPVVLSYTVCDAFPEAFEHPSAPTWPEGVEERWDALTEDQQDQRQAWEDHFSNMYETDFGRVFDECMDWLREHRPWARISPGTLGDVMFGPPVNVYDLFAPDRDERVMRACGAEPAPGNGHVDPEGPTP